MNGIRYISVLYTAIILTLTAQGQAHRPEVHAELSADSVFIGDRFELKVTVRHDMMQIIGFPEFEGSIGREIEILEEYGPDTVARNGREITVLKKYTLVTFEEGFHPLGRYPVLYIDKNITDTLFSAETLELVVGTFEINLDVDTIEDIKYPVAMPVLFGEWGGYLAAALAVMVLVGALVWYGLYRRKRNRAHDDTKILEPAHVRAIRQLEELHNRKLWQNGQYKHYYTALTDIFRRYIEDRYQLPAMEMTSAEIIAAIEAADGIPRPNSAEASQVLRTADLAKFANFTPLPDYHETAYNHIYYFIETTKATEVEQIDREVLDII